MGAGCVETTVGESELDIVQIYLLHPRQLATVCLLIKAYVKVSSKGQRAAWRRIEKFGVNRRQDVDGVKCGRPKC